MESFRMLVEVRERGALGTFEWRAYTVRAENEQQAIVEAANHARVIDGYETRFVAPALEVR